MAQNSSSTNCEMNELLINTTNEPAPEQTNEPAPEQTNEPAPEQTNEPELEIDNYNAQDDIQDDTNWYDLYRDLEVAVHGTVIRGVMH